MKTVTLTIPVSEAAQLLDNLPIMQYPRTVIALLVSQELEVLTPRLTVAQLKIQLTVLLAAKPETGEHWAEICALEKKIIEAERALACACDECAA